jgi:hypothetical protein
MLTAAQRASSNIVVPYGEGRFTVTVANNAFTSPTTFTSSYDNGPQTIGSNIVKTSDATLPLAKTGAWLVTLYVLWPNGTSGFRALSIGQNFSGGTWGQDIVTPASASYSAQSTSCIIQVATNAGYSVYPLLYQNSGGSLSVTGGVMRAVHLGGITP